MGVGKCPEGIRVPVHGHLPARSRAALQPCPTRRAGVDPRRHPAHGRNVKKNKSPRNCRLCGRFRAPSEDHVPPRGSLPYTSQEVRSIFQALGGPGDSSKPTFVQNGVTFWSICKYCNSFMGHEYDVEINRFTASIRHYLSHTRPLPDRILVPVKVQRLLKGVLGHLVAAMEDDHLSDFDVTAASYVLDLEAPLPDSLHVFYWSHPWNNIVVERDFWRPCKYFNIHSVIACFSTLKYYPIAFLVGEHPEYAALPSFDIFRTAGVDEVVQLPIDLTLKIRFDWPEFESATVLGKAAWSSRFSSPRTPRKNK